MAEDSDESVRWGVAENPKSPPKALTKLATDKIARVRAGVAQSHKCPANLFKKLATDKSSKVRGGAASNPKCPTELLARWPEADYRWIRKLAKAELARRRKNA